MTIQVRFTDRDWKRIERDWTAWWAGDLNRPLVVIEGWDSPDGLPPAKRRQFVTHFPDDTPVDDLMDHYQQQLESKQYFGDAWPKWWPNFGPGIGAGFLGAQVLTAEDTVWFEPTEHQKIEDIHLAFDAANLWWQRVQALTQAAVQRWGDRVSIGHTDIGGNLDILVSLHTTQKLAVELYDAPDEVLRLVHEITEAWFHYYDGLHRVIKQTGRGTTPWAPIWSPKRTYMLQSDFSFMISPRMFERFVMPDLVTSCDKLDHAFYHLDGQGELPHLDMLLSIDRLRGIQWIPGAGQPPPEKWLPLLHRIRDGGKLCQLYVTPEGARTIVRELGGHGFAFFVEDYMSAEDAKAFLQILAAEDIGQTEIHIPVFQTETRNMAEPEYSGPDQETAISQEEEILDDIYDNTLAGREQPAIESTRAALSLGMKPAELLFEAMIPALEEVGRLLKRAYAIVRGAFQIRHRIGSGLADGSAALRSLSANRLPIRCLPDPNLYMRPIPVG